MAELRYAPGYLISRLAALESVSKVSIEQPSSLNARFDFSFLISYRSLVGGLSTQTHEHSAVYELPLTSWAQAVVEAKWRLAPFFAFGCEFHLMFNKDERQQEKVAVWIYCSAGPALNERRHGKALSLKVDFEFVDKDGKVPVAHPFSMIVLF